MGFTRLEVETMIEYYRQTGKIPHSTPELLETSKGIRDLITGERGIQAFLNVYLGLSALYLVYSEKELEKGYADLVLEPFLAQYPGVKVFLSYRNQIQ